MKSSIILAALTTLAATQAILDMPSCSIACLEIAMVKADCAVDDIHCACSASQFINDNVTPCLQEECTYAEYLTFQNMAIEICQTAGVPIAPTEEMTGAKVMHHNHSDDIIIAHTFWATLTHTGPIERPTDAPCINPYSGFIPEYPTSFPDTPSIFTAYPTSFRDAPPTVMSCVFSTVTLTHTVAMTSKVPLHPGLSSLITSTAIYTATGTLASTTDMPMFTGAAIMGARPDGAVAAGVIRLLGLVF